MTTTKVEMGEKKIELSRLYPFGETNEVKAGNTTKKVTVLRINELNGFDNVAIFKRVDKGEHLTYLQIAASAGIDYDEALLLVDRDTNSISEVIENF